MPSLEKIAARDETKERTLKLKTPEGDNFDATVTYYPNRLTAEPVELTDEQDEAEQDDTGRASMRDAISFAEIIGDWDITGPVKSRTGEVLVERDAPIPLDPKILRCVPLWLRVDIINAIRNIEFPNRNGSRNSRRRS
jgi:hypothetical protein